MARVNSDGSIVLSTKVDTSGIDKGLKEITKRANKTKPLNELNKSVGVLAVGLKSIGSLMLAAFSVKVINDFRKEAMELAAQLQQVNIVAETSFGGAIDKLEEFAASSIKNYGLSKATSKEIASSYMLMASGMDIAQETASEMSLVLTGLAGDMAAFRGIEVEEARTALSSIFTGETETLKKYGVLLTETNLQQYAYSLGIEKSIATMTQQEKVALRYRYVLNATKNDQGAFVKLQNTWGVRMRTNNEIMKESNTIFGEAFVIIGTLLLPVINGLIQAYNALSQITLQAAKNIYAFVTGEEYKVQVNDTEQVKDNINSAVDGQENLTEEIKDTNKQLKKSLAAFDDIQILANTETENNNNSIWGQLMKDANTAYKTGTEDILTEVQRIVQDVLLIGGWLFVTFGIVLLAFGQWKFGIPLLIFGIMALGITFTSEKGGLVRDIDTVVGQILAIGGSLFLVLGLVLTLAQQYQWGIPLLIAGAGALGYTIAVNWDKFKVFLGILLKDIAEITPHLALMLGIVFMLTGNYPFGFGMLGLATVLYTSKDYDWNALLVKLQETWGAIKQWWNEDVQPYFERSWWEGLLKVIGDVFIWSFEGAINSTIDLFNWFVKTVNNCVNTVVGYINVALGLVENLINKLRSLIGLSQINLEIPTIPTTDNPIKHIDLSDYSDLSAKINSPIVSGKTSPYSYYETRSQIEDKIAYPTVGDSGMFDMSKVSINNNVILEVDGREFGRVALQAINNENNRVGASIVSVNSIGR